MKNPKQKCLYDNLVKASQANLESIDEQAYIVQAQTKLLAAAIWVSLQKKGGAT